MSYKSKYKTTGIISASTITMASIIIVSLMLPTAFADIPEDATVEDHGDFWGYTIQFIFAGSDAESIEWDFGDGSDVSTDWNPEHTYSEIGEYIVTQTVYNSFEGGSVAKGYYKLNILGAPYVEFIQPDGAPALDRVYAYLDGGVTDDHRTITEPEEPVWTDHEFVGWFADAEYTVPFDWDIKLNEPVDVYVGWSGYAPIYHTLIIKSGDGTTISTINVLEGASVSMPASPIGKVATYYIDSDLTEEFDWETVITEDITIYRVLEDEVVIVPDEQSPGYVISGTILLLSGAGILFLIVGYATRRPGTLIVAILLMAIAVTGVLDVIEVPEIIKNFEGYEIPGFSDLLGRG
ncbi:MAG TPA: PKD domain-containing protein [Candidatus Methanomethylophilaceae archaeon]|nr:PKD domain-containing protein [Candidatus Methanomethylophilaceae archaeon]